MSIMKTTGKPTVKNYIGLAGVTFLLTLAACSNNPEPETGKNAVMSSSPIKLEVYKSPTCSCCQDWIDYVEEDGFEALVHHPSDLGGVKQQHGISPYQQSCHTAVSEQGFVFEGHIPSRLVKQFLANPPKNATGLTVPGMPFGSPGMEMGDRVDQYNVLIMYKGGRSELYARVKGQQVLEP